MARMVNCVKLKKEAEGLDYPPFPGALGARIWREGGGFTTVILLMLFIGSITMISLGIIGYYIAKIYDEIKGRPRFIVSHTCGGDDNN